jgi:DNA-binding transcriptional ArsR family regulator
MEDVPGSRVGLSGDADDEPSPGAGGELAGLDLTRKPLTHALAVELTDLFKILTVDTRLQLIDILSNGQEVCVGDLAIALDHQSISTVSNQLERLYEDKVVDRRRDGKYILYRLTDGRVLTMIALAQRLLEKAPDISHRHNRTSRLHGRAPADEAIISEATTRAEQVPARAPGRFPWSRPQP